MYSKTRAKPKRIFLPLRLDDNGQVTAIHYYRALLPLKIVSERLDYELVAMTPDEVRRAACLGPTERDLLLNSFDCYWLSRLQRKEGLDEFIKTIREYNSKIIFDTDDDLTDRFRDLGSGDDFLATARQADMVTVSTPYLAKVMGKHLDCKPVVLPNYLDTKWFSATSLTAERLSDKITVGFVGTASHYQDWIHATPAIMELATHADVEIIVAGYTPDYLQGMPNMREIGGVSYPWYPGVMRQFDIVCCALDHQDKFNKSKSAVKALEAMCAARELPNGKIGGAVPVCTDVKLYRRVVNRGNGVLISNSDWYPALKELVNNSILRQKLAVQGHRWVRKHRDIRQGYRGWSQVLQRILA